MCNKVADFHSQPPIAPLSRRSPCGRFWTAFKPANVIEKAALITTCAAGLIGGWTYFLPALAGYSSLKFFDTKPASGVIPANSKPTPASAVIPVSPEPTLASPKPKRLPTVCILSSAYKDCSGDFLFNHKLALELLKSGQWNVVLVAQGNSKTAIVPKTSYPIFLIQNSDSDAEQELKKAELVIRGLADTAAIFPELTKQKSAEGRCFVIGEYSMLPRFSQSGSELILTGPAPVNQSGIFLAENPRNQRETFFSLTCEQLKQFLLESGYASSHFYFGYGHTRSLVNFVSLAIALEGDQSVEDKKTAIFLIPGTAHGLNFPTEISSALSQQRIFSKVRMIEFATTELIASQNYSKAYSILAEAGKIGLFPPKKPSIEELRKMFEEDPLFNEEPLFLKLLDPPKKARIRAQELNGCPEGKKGLLDVILWPSVLHSDVKVLMSLSRAVHVTGDQSFSEAATATHHRPWVYEMLSHKALLYENICQVGKAALGPNSHFVQALIHFRYGSIKEAAMHLSRAEARREYEAVSGYLVRNADLGRNIRKRVQDFFSKSELY